jgi:hypothetical protein
MKRTNMTLRLLAMLAFAGAIAGWPATATAANQIYACVNNSSGTIHIVGASASCGSNEILLVWNISGTNGTNGTNGIDGTSVTFVGYFAGNQNGCPNGGAIYAAGTPPQNAYVCNGMNGQSVTRAAGPCFDNINRYVDCGNGTVTDTVTGLIWLKDAACLGSHDWAGANQAAASLKNGDCGGNLTDNSSPGDWRLPTTDEWRATVAPAVALGCRITLTKDDGRTCFGDGTGSSFAGVVSFYWSGSSDGTFPAGAPLANLANGSLGQIGPKGAALPVWPVRRGAGR